MVPENHFTLPQQYRRVDMGRMHKLYRLECVCGLFRLCGSSSTLRDHPKSAFGRYLVYGMEGIIRKLRMKRACPYAQMISQNMNDEGLNFGIKEGNRAYSYSRKPPICPQQGQGC